MSEHNQVAIIGAGQGGLSTSYYLSKAGIEHVVLDKGEIAQAWRNERWDTFCLVTPNWTVNLPGQPYNGGDPDGFMPRDEFVAYFEEWARGFHAPVRTGVEVHKVKGVPGRFDLETSQGRLTADRVIVATATYQKPRTPKVAGDLPDDIFQINARDYKNPDQLPAGAVLVVGSGQTGCQLAEDLDWAGRKVFLCVGRSGRLPRRYRGRDCLEWQRDMKLLDRTPDMLDNPTLRFVGDPHLSGRNGGHTVSLHDFHKRGITLVGRLTSADGRTVSFAPDLNENVEYADRYARDFRTAVDGHIRAQGVDAPAPTTAELAGDPLEENTSLPTQSFLDLDVAGIRSVVWATGFSYDFEWVDFPVRDSMGYPQTARGVTAVPGLYFMGLNWMYKRKSGILYGVDEDAAYVADHLIASLSKPNRREAS